MPFSQLGLADQLVQAIRAAGYEKPTPVQEQTIPQALTGRDVVGIAQTGTGKTAAFALPILHRLMQVHGSGTRAHARALVLVPTRELAQQVEDFFTSYGRFGQLRTAAIFGGVNMQNQIKKLQRGVDIIIATPGRLLDHLSQRTVDLSQVETLVLDEADRMLDMGFIADVRKIIGRIPAGRQTLLFSATMPTEIEELAASTQRNPVRIAVGEQRRPVDSVAQTFYAVAREAKLPLLLHILATAAPVSVLVFARTKHGADKITRRLLRNNIRAAAIHSNRTQAQRERALAGFKNGQHAVLVATDIAARGIDVEGISHVINYDTPAFAEEYIHRIGRTGRADATGDAMTFVSPDERPYFRRIEQYTGKRHELAAYQGFDPAAALAQGDQPATAPQEAGKPREDRAAPASEPRRQHHERERPRQGEHDRRGSDRGDRRRPQGQQAPSDASGRPRQKREPQQERKRDQRPGQRRDERRDQRTDQLRNKRPDQRTDQPRNERTGQRADQPRNERRDQRPDERRDQRRDQRPDQRRDQKKGRPGAGSRTPGQGKGTIHPLTGERIREPRPKRGTQSVPPVHASTRPIQKADWEQLLTTAEEKLSISKKLRQFFKRAK